MNNHDKSPRNTKEDSDKNQTKDIFRFGLILLRGSKHRRYINKSIVRTVDDTCELAQRDHRGGSRTVAGNVALVPTQIASSDH
jgi:hypothetical protein